MKKSQLRQIIQEETSKVLKEAGYKMDKETGKLQKVKSK